MRARGVHAASRSACAHKRAPTRRRVGANGETTGHAFQPRFQRSSPSRRGMSLASGRSPSVATGLARFFHSLSGVPIVGRGTTRRRPRRLRWQGRRREPSASVSGVGEPRMSSTSVSAGHGLAYRPGALRVSGHHASGVGGRSAIVVRRRLWMPPRGAATTAGHPRNSLSRRRGWPTQGPGSSAPQSSPHNPALSRSGHASPGGVRASQSAVWPPGSRPRGGPEATP